MNLYVAYVYILNTLLLLCEIYLIQESPLHFHLPQLEFFLLKTKQCRNPFTDLFNLKVWNRLYKTLFLQIQKISQTVYIIANIKTIKERNLKVFFIYLQWTISVLSMILLIIGARIKKRSYRCIKN